MTTPTTESSGQTIHHPPSGYVDDAYGEGFVDGRASMAETIAKQLLDRMSNEEIMLLTGLSVDAVDTLRHPDGSPTSEPEATAAETTQADDTSFGLIRETPTPDTAFVEPNFVRLIREVKQITQAELAQQLDVHERTVGSWETANKPVRLRTATYEKLILLSKT